MLQRWESFLRAIVGRSRDFMFLTTSWNDKIEFNGRHTRLRCIILSSKQGKMRHIGWQEPLSDIRKIPLLANSTFLLQPRRLVAPGVRREDWDGNFTNTSPNILDRSKQFCNYVSCMGGFWFTLKVFCWISLSVELLFPQLTRNLRNHEKLRLTLKLTMATFDTVSRWQF